MLPKKVRYIIQIIFHTVIAGFLIGMASLESLKGDYESSKALTIFAIIVGMYLPAVVINMKIDERFDRMEELLKKLSQKDEQKESRTDKLKNE